MLDSIRSLFDKQPPIERSSAEQSRVDAETAAWSLYLYVGCLFCSRVERAIDRLALRIERRDIQQEPRYRGELVEGGGRATVPCLRIADENAGGDRWMYESADIVAFLERRFTPSRAGESSP
jgi:glutaredoxin